jgi:phosphotransacetylase
MNPIQKFIVLNLFENTPEVFKFIRRMEILKTKNKMEKIADNYIAARLDLEKIADTYTETIDVEDFIQRTNNTIAGLNLKTMKSYITNDTTNKDDLKNYKKTTTRLKNIDFMSDEEFHPDSIIR